jgi:YfiH family protein
MIRPPALAGAAFTHADDGDIRNDGAARAAVSAQLRVVAEWATLTQVHGDKVVEATGPGNWGEADAVFTTVIGLPLAVFTADCAGVLLIGEGTVGVAHAGWRGAASGVVRELANSMERAGHAPSHAAIGPSIGPCCFEVGTEVADRFPGYGASTTWGTSSVDLWKSLVAQLDGMDVWSARMCTRHEPGWFSHRKNATDSRMASIVWIP